MNDEPIHLKGDGVGVSITLRQSFVDGLYTLIVFCEGMRAAGRGDIPGHFEALMLYREIAARVAEKQGDG